MKICGSIEGRLVWTRLLWTSWCAYISWWVLWFLGADPSGLIPFSVETVSGYCYWKRCCLEAKSASGLTLSSTQLIYNHQKRYTNSFHPKLWLNFTQLSWSSANNLYILYNIALLTYANHQVNSTATLLLQKSILLLRAHQISSTATLS